MALQQQNRPGVSGLLGRPGLENQDAYSGGYALRYSSPATRVCRLTLLRICCGGSGRCLRHRLSKSSAADEARSKHSASDHSLNLVQTFLQTVESHTLVWQGCDCGSGG